MNICFFINNISGRGGTERMTVSLANRLIEDGYDISIISLYSCEEPFFELNSKIKQYSIFDKVVNSSLRAFYITTFIRKIVKLHTINILINVDSIQALFSLPVKFFIPDLKIISWEHFNFKTNLGVKRRDWARFFSKKYADAIVTLTEQDKIFYLENGNPRARVVSIPNFIRKLPPEISSLENKIVIAVGRFTYQKGFDLLVDVWAQIKLQDVSNNWILKIIGDGKEKDNIKEKIKSLDLESSIEIHDATENIGDYYSSASLYVSSSRFEGLPMVLIEAMTYGLPIVGFDCLTGPSDLIKNNGYLIPMNESSLMASKIRDLMSNKEKREEMGQISRKDANYFLIDIVIQKWIKLFITL